MSPMCISPTSRTRTLMTRSTSRSLIVGCLLSSALSQIACGDLAGELAEQLDPVIKRHRGQVSVAIEHLESGISYRRDADRPMPTASLIKLAVMAEAYQQAAEGKLDLNQMVQLRDQDKVPGSGLLTRHFSDGASISVKDAIRLMIAFSDNTATNLVLDQIGLESTRQRMRKWNLPHTAIYAKVFKRESSIDPEASRRFGLGSTTANETLLLLKKLERNELVSAAASQQMQAHLAACEDRTKLLREIPESIDVYHKTGSVSRVRADAGVLKTSTGPLLICVLTSENEDRSWESDNAAEVLCGRIAKIAFDTFHVESLDPDKPTPLRIGSSGIAVEDLQRTLNRHLDPADEISVDGDFGPQTQSALKKFQQAAGLPVNGVADAGTWKALGPIASRDVPVPDPADVNQQPLVRQPPEPLDGPPAVTCRAWAIADLDTGELLFGMEPDKPLDMASTTKIMTAHVVLEMCAASPQLLEETVVFSRRADRTPGSTAGVRTGEQLSVRELLYGLLLPSGNDASVALAEHFGAQLPAAGDASPYDRFIAEMNRQAAELKMNSTRFANPHGLTADGHETTAADLLRLARAALQHPLLRDIVNTRQHGCRLVGSSGYERNVLWKNTNQLLEYNGYFGVKTGTTSAAGACLVSASERDGAQQLLVVLGSQTSAARYVDSRNLHRWAWRQRLSGDRAAAKEAGPSPAAAPKP